MKTKISSSKSGGVLVIVVIVLVASTLVISALLQLARFNEVETVKQLRYAQAQWLAEAGLQRALGWVLASDTYRINLESIEPGSFSLPYSELPNGEYALKVWRPDADKIIIQSMGTAASGGISESETIQVQLNYSSGIPGAIVGIPNYGLIDIGQNTTVSGSVYRSEGTIKIDGTVSDNVYIGDGTNPTGGGTYTQGYIPEPDTPSIDTSYFYGLIGTAQSGGEIFKKNKDLGGTINLAGNTRYINVIDSKGNPFDKVSTINGPGKLVVYGKLDLKKIDSIGDGIEIISSDNMIIRQHVDVGNETEFFTQGSMEILQDIEGGNMALMAVGDIDFKHTVDVKGIVYAGGNIDMDHKVDFYGTIIGGGDITLGKSGNGAPTNISYDPDVYSSLFHIDFGNSIITSNQLWQVVSNP